MKSIEVVAAAIYKDGKVLAAQRGYGEFKGGWEFPGGKVEPGESLEEAIVREIQEEMETMIEVGEKIGIVEDDYPNFHLKMHCFWAKETEGEFKLLEHDEVMWLDKKSIQTLQWLPADVELVEKVAKRLDYQS